MKIADLFVKKKAVFSFEVFPPKKDAPVNAIYHTLEQLSPLAPDFISVTYGAGGAAAGATTCEIASAIKLRYGVEPLAHLTCVNSSRAQVTQTLAHLKESGVENILALRGDRNPDLPMCTDFHYASDLIAQVRNYGNFCISAACYPEGHVACESLEEDIGHLKEKVDAGASHLITQLFFDNTDFYHFLEMARKKKIQIPIQAGVMPLVNKNQIERMVSMCGASLPKALVRLISRYESDPLALRDAAIAYTVRQIVDLLANGVQGIHLYTMNNPLVARRICESITSILECENRPHA